MPMECIKLVEKRYETCKLLQMLSVYFEYMNKDILYKVN